METTLFYYANSAVMTEKNNNNLQFAMGQDKALYQVENLQY